MPRGASGASLAVLRAVAPLGLLLVALAATLGWTGHATRGTQQPRRQAVAQRLPLATQPALTQPSCGQPFVEVVEKELDEEGDRAVEPPSRVVALDHHETQLGLVEAADERPACLVRLLAFPIRGPPSA